MSLWWFALFYKCSTYKEDGHLCWFHVMRIILFSLIFILYFLPFDFDLHKSRGRNSSTVCCCCYCSVHNQTRKRLGWSGSIRGGFGGFCFSLGNEIMFWIVFAVLSMGVWSHRLIRWRATSWSDDPDAPLAAYLFARIQIALTPCHTHTLAHSVSGWWFFICDCVYRYKVLFTFAVESINYIMNAVHVLGYVLGWSGCWLLALF